ncbi:hypothetical protein [Aquimarina aquimarini]|uniref:hypothetical protein n=1 Tax=Aquimarina aquimarini TaxID=1191734 RepID=UPI001F1F4FD5|nr:hypothetical protein [Aquimarina aquimarini]
MIFKIYSFGLFNTIIKTLGFGELVPLFMAADVISTKVVNEILNDFSNEAMLEWQRRKLKGLNNALAWVKNNQGAKMLGLDVKEFVSQTAYEKLLCNEFKSFKEFDNYEPNEGDNDKNWYSCFYYENREGEKTKYLIDSIFLRQ